MDRPANYSMLSWNVRGLNSAAKQEDVKHLISTFRPDLFCLQETKMAIIDQQAICNFFCAGYKNSLCFLPAEGTRGGIVLATRDSSFTLHDSFLTANTITSTVTDTRNNSQWTVTGVYDPQGDLDKKRFIRELRHLKSMVKPHWLILGDFNLIYKDQDKSNGRLNRHLMLRFRRALNHMDVKEVDLIGRRFTWSSN